MKPADVVDEATLTSFMIEPSNHLVEAAGRIEGPVLFLGGSGKMGPELAGMMQRASAEAGTGHEVIVASTFSDPKSKEALESTGVRCIRGDLTDHDFLASLPDAPNIVYLLGFKFGSGSDWRRAFHLNCIVPYLVGERYPESSIVVFSSTNPYGPLPYDRETDGATEEVPFAPEGIYAWSIIAREEAFATTALRHSAQRICNFRLTYAQHFAYGVLRDLVEMVWRGEPVSLQVPAVNLISQRDAIDYALLCLERCANSAWTVNVSGPAFQVRDLAIAIGEVVGRDPVFAGEEGEMAGLTDDALCRSSLGEPRDSVEDMVEPIARWVMREGLSWNKPTHFGSAERKY